MRTKGYWFYGLSGSGKTFASNILKKKIQNCLIVDGDLVRKIISKDLSYNIQDRKIQLSRMIGIAQLAINSNLIPIVSTVYLDKVTFNKLKKNKFKIIKIERDMVQVYKKHPTYKKKKNIVGIDINLPRIKTKIIFNDMTNNFKKKVLNLV